MNTGISIDRVKEIHDEELIKFGGLAGIYEDKLEGALARIDQHIYYNAVEDVFTIAALYLVAIAKAHAFSDGNKRTALVVSLTYLQLQGIRLPRDCGLDDFMVEVAASQDDPDELTELVADCLYRLAEKHNQL